AKELIGKESKNNTSCPICESVLCTEDISEHFEISDNVKLDNEINSITRRCRELLELIHKNRSDLTEHVKNLNDLYKEKKDAEKYIDEELSKSISPYLSERDFLVREIAKNQQIRDALVSSLKVRNKQRDIAEKIGKIDSDI
ncbi:hypothetical protein EAY42_24430, partial [Vibrio anguillarum]|nr:hypothetical protein [Vibrio anguillarum]